MTPLFPLGLKLALWVGLGLVTSFVFLAGVRDIDDGYTIAAFIVSTVVILELINQVTTRLARRAFYLAATIRLVSGIAFYLGALAFVADFSALQELGIHEFSVSKALGPIGGGFILAYVAVWYFGYPDRIFIAATRNPVTPEDILRRHGIDPPQND